MLMDCLHLYIICISLLLLIWYESANFLMTITEELEYENIVNSLRGKLPSLPLILDELMTIISDPNAALFAIKDVIQTDPSTYVQILKIANTVEYRGGQEKRIINLDEAMHKLGLEKVKQISQNISILKLFKEIEFTGYFSPESLWAHSVGVAVTSLNLARFLSLSSTDKAYTCGLIHDIGKLAKLKYDQKMFCRELKQAKIGGTDNYQTEISQSGIRHDKLGGLIANVWGISSTVEAVCKWHHEEDRSKRTDVINPDDNKVIDIIQISNNLVNSMGFGNSGHNLKIPLSKKIMKRLRLSEIDLEEFKDKLLPELEREKQSLNALSENITFKPFQEETHS